MTSALVNAILPDLAWLGYIVVAGFLWYVADVIDKTNPLPDRVIAIRENGKRMQGHRGDAAAIRYSIAIVGLLIVVMTWGVAL